MSSSSSDTILLRPRPYSSLAVLLLVPLLPPPPVHPSSLLPAETWFRILAFACQLDTSTAFQTGLMRVSKSFRDLAAPLFYADPPIRSLAAFTRFTSYLVANDRKWDSIRRIPYSTPGRWVQILDLSTISPATASERLKFDGALASVFPTLPFLSGLSLNPNVQLSRRAMSSLGESAGTKGTLRVLKGIVTLVSAPRPWDDDPLMDLLRMSELLEIIEIIGSNPQDAELEDEESLLNPTGLEVQNSTYHSSLHLPHLHTLVIHQLPDAPILRALTNSPLPALRALSISLFPTKVPSTSLFLAAHSNKLLSLDLPAPQMWPPVTAPIPPKLLSMTPNLRSLTLSFPLPALTTPSTPHPLRILSLPRPTTDFLPFVAQTFGCLREVRFINTNRPRAGLGRPALATGLSGLISEWQRRLGTRGVRVLFAGE